MTATPRRTPCPKCGPKGRLFYDAYDREWVCVMCSWRAPPLGPPPLLAVGKRSPPRRRTSKLNTGAEE